LVRIHELPGTSRSAVQPLRDVTSIVQGLKDHDQRKAERRVVQMRNAREKAARLKAQADKLAEESGKGVEAGTGTGTDEPKIGTKRKAQDDDVSENADADADVDQDQDEVEAEATAALDDEIDMTTPTRTNPITWTPPVEPSSTLFSQILLRTQPDMRGHTSYLTFATLPPRSVREALAAQGDRAGSGSGWSTPVVPNAGKGGKEKERAKTSVLDVSAGAGEVSGRGEPTGTVNAPIAVSSTIEGDIGADDKTEMTEMTAATDYGDQALEQAMGTLTEEEMAAMLAGSKA
jgi:tRNA (adenine57-N1/adenine58-N1)-methyltransferase